MDEDAIIRKINLIQACHSFGVRPSRHHCAETMHSSLWLESVSSIADSARRCGSRRGYCSRASRLGCSRVVRDTSQRVVCRPFAREASRCQYPCARCGAVSRQSTCDSEMSEAPGVAHGMLCWRRSTQHLMRHCLQTLPGGFRVWQAAELQQPRRGSGYFASPMLAMQRTCTPARAQASDGHQALFWCAGPDHVSTAASSEQLHCRLILFNGCGRSGAAPTARSVWRCSRRAAPCAARMSQ